MDLTTEYITFSVDGDLVTSVKVFKWMDTQQVAVDNKKYHNGTTRIVGNSRDETRWSTLQALAGRTLTRSSQRISQCYVPDNNWFYT
jgi:hypothetical protein